MVILKQIFSYARDNGHLHTANPAATLKLPKKQKKEDDLPYIAEDQIEEFKKMIRENCQSGNESL